MTTASVFENVLHSRIKPAAGRLFWLGLAMVLIGVVALVFPVVSTMAATLFIGWVLLFAGVVTVAGAFSIHGTGPFFGALLLGLLSVALGLFLAFNPAAGALSLTLVVGVIFAIQAAYEVVFAFEMRPNNGWGAMLISGVASGVVAVVIITGWPGVSLIALGVLFGVNFVSTGLAYIVVSRTVRAALK
jgi:uncharacterized membrane protein HdeD (DUF308 family)